MSKVYKQLQDITTRLETHYKDVQDFEFTIQEGRLYLLQSRAAKRTPWAALRVACDLVNEDVIDPPASRGVLEPVERPDLRLGVEGQDGGPVLLVLFSEELPARHAHHPGGHIFFGQQRLGFQVEVADSAESALRQIDEPLPDVVFMDQLPRTNVGKILRRELVRMHQETN